MMKMRQTLNMHNFISVQDIDKIFACMVGFSGSANSNMLSKNSREPREFPQQQNFGKKSQNCTDFSSGQEIKEFFTCIVRLSVSATSNILSRISKEPRKLPWQPNLDKNKQK